MLNAQHDTYAPRFQQTLFGRKFILADQVDCNFPDPETAYRYTIVFRGIISSDIILDYHIIALGPF